MHAFRRLGLLALLTVAAPACAQASLQAEVEAQLARAAPGTRFGMLVVDAAGREVVAVRPDDRFVPASTTKLVTTAAAFALLPVNEPDAAGGAVVRVEGRDVVLEGHGDSRLSSAAECLTDCLATLADAVAARTHEVGDVIGDDRAFADLRWSPGMSWNNIGTRSGAAISALTLDDNQMAVRIAPGAVGAPLRVESAGLFPLDNRTATVAEGMTQVTLERMPFDRIVHLSGSLPVGAAVVTRTVGVDDPAEWAAWRFRTMLEARGVRVRGVVRARHRMGDAALPPTPGTEIARLTPLPLVEDLHHTNKTSDNLHAELLLRRLGGGSAGEGEKAVSALLAQAGVPRWSYAFADGSGMSTYNRVTPRAMVQFLRWAAGQPWGTAWRATLPVGGVDGTLSKRFRDGDLAGRVIAKTGTLAGARALAGTLRTVSGAELTFAMFAGDAPAEARPVETMDAVLALIAAHN
ncbi:D-alanyl-D-alanine carboxypeptidase/D-alanyl-D-alanine-endopeptidase [Sphingomonas sp. R1]|uniref:D-alanyl-D-alanine carboxypeptidase/D-alanyl-D-alanine endopeptidase n=1 Tax=Sphingomonas sp. R1 TaxID=399176 RepID=UPI002223F5BB|nr:D-alanyl-D-alanine carboxypeptidase/D-alanyl-D-alanine-endopeptidase [Sphingomonas sp. R1]UYY77901.1 D-alanyl-D-alanine carboxypeptidase/D-alanyl-D-alanine-endopeptidase [Sphingomonas sp. R1]